MQNNFIPHILKEKIIIISKYTKTLAYILISLFLFLSLLSFDINDNSFLSKSSMPSNNIFGDPGSYISSFIIYTFGIMGYLIVFFFINYALSTIFNKKLNYLFIRLLAFFLSLILIPQIFLINQIGFTYIDNLSEWGSLSIFLFGFTKNVYVSYSLSLVGLFLFLSSQSLFGFLRISKINFKFKMPSSQLDKNKEIQRKEPIIKNVSSIIKKDLTDERLKEKKVKFNSEIPSLDILENETSNTKIQLNKSEIEERSSLLERVFLDFNIEIKVINIKLGPVVTLFEILPAAGIKINTVINLAGDISRSMGVGAVRISQIYGTQYLGVEVPNQKRQVVTIKELLSNENFKKTNHKIPICIGKDISGHIEVIDLSKTPHLLVAGTTGSGKSVFINTLLSSILYSFPPDRLRLLLIDPKMLELSVYNDIAHLLTPVVTEPKKAIIALKWVCKEMERRYSLMNEEGSRNLEGFNEKSHEKLPYIVVVIDEMADLMMTAGKEVEHYVQRLAQMARACGIHLVMATQRPSVDIITGSIKANFPSRISFQVASKYDSRTILGEVGAEQLLGNGDMLMMKNGGNITRYQSAFISDNEVAKIISEIKKNQKVQYLEEIEEIIKNDGQDYDELSEEDEALITKSIDLIRDTNKASTSFLQRNFQIGYNKAARIMETLEKRGVVSEPNHAGKRQILLN